MFIKVSWSGQIVLSDIVVFVAPSLLVTVNQNLALRGFKKDKEGNPSYRIGIGIFLFATEGPNGEFLSPVNHLTAGNTIQYFFFFHPVGLLFLKTWLTGGN